jgi:hypothetical protein
LPVIQEFGCRRFLQAETDLVLIAHSDDCSHA